MTKAIALLLSICAFHVALAQSGTEAPKIKDITPQALSALLGKAHVYDVNEDYSYAEAHVPGARLVAYDAITPEVLPADRSSMLVFYCWSPECPAASTAATTAARLGFTDVYFMSEGITGWQSAGLPTEP